MAGETPSADPATQLIGTTESVLGHTELAARLAERAQRLEAAVLKEESSARPLDELLLCEFHQRTCDDLTLQWAGKWRTAEVTAGHLIPRPPRELPILTPDFTRDIQARWEGTAGNDVDLTLYLLRHSIRSTQARALD